MFASERALVTSDHLSPNHEPRSPKILAMASQAPWNVLENQSPIPENILTIASHASWNVLENQSPAPPRMLVIPSHALWNVEIIVFQMFVKMLIIKFNNALNIASTISSTPLKILEKPSVILDISPSMIPVITSMIPLMISMTPDTMSESVSKNVFNSSPTRLIEGANSLIIFSMMKVIKGSSLSYTTPIKSAILPSNSRNFSTAGPI